ncbi:midasin-like [Alnus glutinosa]|uniref:midasin-like n=1 Tax=Alnus glutinosa TaxID=3517 RepID=UPI002D785E79|nr:midasin-like [Alnus glutinosa]
MPATPERGFFGVFPEPKQWVSDFWANSFSDFQENIQQMSSLLLSSSHCRLKELVYKFIEPLLRDLYLHRTSTGDFDYVLGCAWLRIGGLGFHLLLSCDDLDPAMKFYWKSSQSVEKITSLKLEMQGQRC